MYIQSIIDPYEQKLLNLFKNFEVDGKLNENGLNNLCQTLQLKDRFSLLVKLLYKNGNKTGVTFDEFREGLLHVITSEDDGMMSADSHSFLLFYFLLLSLIYMGTHKHNVVVVTFCG